MHIKVTSAIILCGALSFGRATTASTTDSELQMQLRAKDQAMVDAFVTGDRAVFDAAMAPDAVYLDENGRRMDRAAFLADIKPLPPNISGHIELADYTLSHFGDLATVTFTEVETEDYHGQILHANYLTSETWRNTSSGWKLAMVQTMAVLKDPPEVQLPRRDWAAYTGTYRAAPDLLYEVKIEGGRLVGGLVGDAAAPLHAELKDVFFIAGRPRTRKIFQRNPQGAITGYVDRREGEDVVWTKVSERSKPH
jgi:ketosteroid isomerase-like protein